MSYKTRTNYATGFKKCGPRCRCLLCRRKNIAKYGCGCEKIDGRKLCPSHGRV